MALIFLSSSSSDLWMSVLVIALRNVWRSRSVLGQCFYYLIQPLVVLGLLQLDREHRRQLINAFQDLFHLFEVSRSFLSME